MTLEQGVYQWGGRGRDTDSLLLSLTSWWLDRLASCRTGQAPGLAPGAAGAAAGGGEELAPGNSTLWTVRPSSLQVYYWTWDLCLDLEEVQHLKLLNC